MGRLCFRWIYFKETLLPAPGCGKPTVLLTKCHRDFKSNYSLKVFQETFNSTKPVFTCSNQYFFALIEVNPLKRQPHGQLLPANCFSVFDHFVGLMLKVLTIRIWARRRRFGVFLLTLNWFHTLLWCFYFWLWNIQAVSDKWEDSFYLRRVTLSHSCY